MDFENLFFRALIVIGAQNSIHKKRYVRKKESMLFSAVSFLSDIYTEGRKHLDAIKKTEIF